MIASHYIISDILEALKEGDLQHAEKIFNKFRDRYHQDAPLIKLHDEFVKYLSIKEPSQLDSLKKKLVELQQSRRIETDGGYCLPYKDRRRFTRKTQIDFED